MWRSLCFTSIVKVMREVESLYKRIVIAVCEEMGTDPVMMLSNNKERNVDARGLVIVILTERRFSEGLITELTGLTQQAVNRLKNLYPDRIRRDFLLHSVWDAVRGMK